MERYNRQYIICRAKPAVNPLTLLDAKYLLSRYTYRLSFSYFNIYTVGTPVARCVACVCEASCLPSCLHSKICDE